MFLLFQSSLQDLVVDVGDIDASDDTLRCVTFDDSPKQIELSVGKCVAEMNGVVDGGSANVPGKETVVFAG